MQIDRDGITLLTGAGGGLGWQIADYLIEAGLRNIACHHRVHRDEITDVLLRHDLDPDRHLFYADLTQEAEVQTLREVVGRKLGRVAHLINLAGGSTSAISWKLSKEAFQDVLDMNLLSTFLCCRAFIPEMREAQYGRIINVSSVVAFRGVAGASHYCAAKAAVVGFSKSIALELVSKGITVNVLGLGYFDSGIINQVPEPLQQEITASIPLKRFGRASEIAACIEYLLSAEAAYMTGQVLHLNGGLYS